MNFAPIVLFVYNRAEHTRRTLEALAANDLAKDSVLYIFADGPKPGADEQTISKIKETRNVIRQKQWCCEVHIVERNENMGLADSIIAGVTEVVNKHERIIVLEDDIVSSPGFLKYMNEALELYEKEDKVFHISAYMFPVKDKLPATFFYKQTSCWGWATWKAKWNMLETSPRKLMQELVETGKIEHADIDGTNQFVEQLNGNMNGSLKTWAVLWHFSVFLKDGLSLHPYKPLVQNIGFDNSGTHCGESEFFNSECANQIDVKPIPVKDNDKVYGLLKNFYKKTVSNGNLDKIRSTIRSSIPSSFKRRIKLVLDDKFKERERENKRLRALPRFIETETQLFEKKLKIVDASSYIFLIKEIFEQQIYKFNSDKTDPVIIDCGANIGLSIIYFKRLFPTANIIAFEPDDKVFNALQHNIESFGFSNVELIKKACWDRDTVFDFFSEGADGGRKTTTHDTGNNIVAVEAVRLKDYLRQKVDLLKIDIEGAEFVVLNDIKDKLHLVNNVFVEYHSFVKEEQTLPELLQILKNAGFRIHISSPGLISPHPLINRPEYLGMDNQLNIYGFRGRQEK